MTEAAAAAEAAAEAEAARTAPHRTL